MVAENKFMLDDVDERVFSGGAPVPMSHKAFTLLRLFVEHSDQLLTKSQIMDALWKDVHVTEGMVKEYVHELRIALNDNARAPTYIQTVHGRGYRFLGGVGLADRPKEIAKTPVVDRPSIAVLPFKSHDRSSDGEDFCDGLCDEITISLSLVPSLFVIARNSSRIFEGDHPASIQDVGELLGVRYVLHGSVRRLGNRYRVLAELLETELGSLVWAHRFESNDRDLFVLQDEIAKAVVNRIGPRIQLAEIDRAARKPPGDLTAYDQLLKARAALNCGDLEQAKVQLNRALQEDPDYTMAKALRAWTFTLIGWDFQSLGERDISDAIELARAALTSPDCDIEARSYAAYTLGFFGVDADHARHVLQQVTQEAPSFAWAWASLALLESYHGPPESAINSANIALTLSPRDPQSFRCEMALSKALLVLGDYRQCLFYADLGLQKSPHNAYFLMCRITSLVKLGRRKDAELLGTRFCNRHSSFRTAAWKKFARNWGAWAQASDVVAEALEIAGIPHS